MTIALGIDTGGTFTDGVVIDLDTKEILKRSKALTTRHDLAIGINECMQNLSEVDLTRADIVALSTTLATNAIVEGQGCEVGTILIGSEAPKKLPTKNVAVVKGGHDIKGKQKEELDVDEVISAINELKPKVDAFAVSGYLSIRNSEHELAVKKLINELTDYPVVCAHELTTTLGFFERTVTATLNARLLPIIADLITAVKKNMRNSNIAAPLMIVKGDGSLISEKVAKDKPIETLLSGPAASINGAQYLASFKDGIVADMGGTTTDIAIVSDGSASLNVEGATVGGWLTRVQAANISTVGIGGDSYIRVDKEGKISVGPQKVFPLAWIVNKHPHINYELDQIANQKFDPLYAQPTDVLVFIKDPLHTNLSAIEQKLVDVLKEKPHTLYALGQILSKDPNIIPWEKLVEMGTIHRSSLTPTDLLHWRQELGLWNVDAAKKALAIQADRAGVSLNEFNNQVQLIMTKKIAVAIMEKILDQEGSYVSFDNCTFCNKIIDKILCNRGENLLNISSIVSYPLIAIGAPASAYFPSIAKKIGAQIHIPDFAEVANAVGAAAGDVVKCIELTIQPNPDGGYLAFTPWGRKWFKHLADATNHCKENGRVYVEKQAKGDGVIKPKIDVDQQDIFGSFSRVWGDEHESLFIESKMKIRATGKPTGIS